MHSIIANIPTLSLAKLLDLINFEFYLNISEYTVFHSADDLHNQLADYIQRKVYNSAIGDLMPLIIANALKRQIHIYNDLLQRQHAIIPRYYSTDAPLMVILRSEHYDALQLASTVKLNQTRKSARKKHQPTLCAPRLDTDFRLPVCATANIRTLIKKVDEIDIFVRTNNIHILNLCETWLNQIGRAHV